MIWFWKRRRRSTARVLAEAQRDLERARVERATAERLTAETRERWGAVHHIANESRLIRRTNHLAEDIRTLFGG